MPAAEEDKEEGNLFKTEKKKPKPLYLKVL